MAADYSILEKELIDLKTKLQRDLYMHQLKRLQKKKSDLSMLISQRRQIEYLTKQKAELEATVSVQYCSQYALKDNEIRGYLIYLLKMKDFFAREVATKEEMIKQKDSQIQIMTRKYCEAMNEKAKKIKNIPVKSPEFVRLENMSDRLNQMNKNISTMRHENQKIMESITNMRKFQAQFKKFEKDFRRKIDRLKGKSHELLEKAVTAYEEKEDFTNKQKFLEERCAQDNRKIAITENTLDICLQKAEKNNEFAKMQDSIRTNLKTPETREKIEKGITGLEPYLQQMQQLHSTITSAAGEKSPENIEETFKVTDNRIAMMFSYFDELLKDIHHLEKKISDVKEENKALMKNMSSTDRTLRKNIKRNQDLTQNKQEKADKASEFAEQTRADMNSLIEMVKCLYIRICPDDKKLLEEKPIDDSNVIDYMQNMEKEILEYLICLQYIRMKEASMEDESLVIDTEEDVDSDDQVDRIEEMNIVQPRELSSECELQSLAELDTEKCFMEFEKLKDKAVAAVSEIQSEETKEDNDEDNAD